MKKILTYFTGKLFFLIPLTGLIAACASEEEQVKKSETTSATISTIETVKVKAQKAMYSLKLPGEIEPYEQVKIFPKIRGFVLELPVDRGDRVRKGQLLAKLEAPEITQENMAASARQKEVYERLNYSQQAYTRLKNASKSAGAVADMELDQALSQLMADSAAYRSMQAEMGAAQQLEDYLEIRAPFDGVISERTVSKGALVGGGAEPLFTLAQQDVLRLVVSIPAKHSSGLQDSIEVRYHLQDHPNEIFSARMSRHSGVLDKTLRSLVVEFDVPNKNGKMHGGEFVQVEIPIRKSVPSLWVPSSSLVNTTTGIFVLKVVDNRIQRVEVQEGIQNDGLTEVHGDILENDLIVLKGSGELKEGDQITYN